MMNEGNRPSVLLVSVDALKPEFVFEQERLGIDLPNISRYFVKGGACARGGVKSVFPTFTYPCHQSMITGVTPATHGIYNNGIFDPMGDHLGAWHWFANHRVKTLWEAAKEHGYVSASVAFPTSVGAKGDYIAPEFWWDGSELDSLFIDAVAKPQGMILEMEKEIGRYAGGLDLSDQGDRQRFQAAMWVLNHKIAPELPKKPFFMTAYFASFDETAHQCGVYSKEAAESLQKIDCMLGEMIERVHELTQGHVTVCVCSDHGTIDNRYNISPNVKLREAGLIDTDENGRVISWRAWSQRAGGTSEIRLKDSEDADAKRRLKEVVEQLAADENSGILEVVDKDGARLRGGFPLAEYVLVAEKGYEIRDNVNGPYCTETLHQKAQHGYSEEFEEMRASFMLEGEGIEAGKNLGSMNLIDIAPTLAFCMGFELPEAEGKRVVD